MSIFEHTQVPLPVNAAFKISPSQIANFFSYPTSWYRQEVLNEQGFTGNTASVLGTAIHYVAEQYARSHIDNVPLDIEALTTQIEADLEALDNPDVNKSEVLSLYQNMAEALINSYVSRNLPTQVETPLVHGIKDGIFVGGSNDAYNENTATVIDYKSAGKKPADTIPFNYKIQALAYAWVLKKQGKPVKRIQIVYVVRPTKTIGIRTIPVTHIITDADWTMIDQTLELMADTILLARSNPDLVYLLFKSMNLKDT